MRMRARGEEWDASKVRTKQKRKDAKTENAKTSTPTPSIFRYSLKPAGTNKTQQTSKQQQLRADRLKRAHAEFVTGSATDRKHLQQQAKQTKAKEKQKTRQAKQNQRYAPPTTSKTTGPKQTDIRDYFTTNPNNNQPGTSNNHGRLTCENNHTQITAPSSTTSEVWAASAPIPSDITGNGDHSTSTTTTQPASTTTTQTPTQQQRPLIDNNPPPLPPTPQTPFHISPIPLHHGRYPTYVDTHTLTPISLSPQHHHHPIHFITTNRTLFY